MNTVGQNINTNYTEERWEKLLSTLSPNKISALEKTLKNYQNKSEFDMETAESNENMNFHIKAEPVTSTRSFYNCHKTKNRGLTYENGRRNLKSENVSYDEMERRSKRRERNRLAAAKCREKRQAQLDVLQREVYILHQTEMNMKSQLQQLNSEEDSLRKKLANHNCLVTESTNGEVNILIQSSALLNPSNFVTPTTTMMSHRPNINQFVPTIDCRSTNSMPINTISSHNQCRPKSLPVNCQNCTSTSNNSTSSNQMNPNVGFPDKAMAALDQLLCKEDVSLTPLLSPDTYNLLKCQIKSEPELPNSTTSQTGNFHSSNNHQQEVSSTTSIMTSNNQIQTVSNNNNVDDEDINKTVFSWSNNAIDELSMSYFEPSSTSYLTTPTVDIQCYSRTHNNQHNINHSQLTEQMDSNWLL